MPFDDEDPPYIEPDPKVDALARAVIGVAIEVHKHLGAGLSEALYEEAMVRELRAQGIPFVRQARIPVVYKGEVIGYYEVDLIIDHCLVVELKSVDELAPVHVAQVMTYLRITDLKLGLLINFNVRLLRHGIKRVIRPDSTTTPPI